jgi:hypothetical protein
MRQCNQYVQSQQTLLSHHSALEEGATATDGGKRDSN